MPSLRALLSFILATLFALGGVEASLRVRNASMHNYDIEMWKYATRLKRRSANPILGHEHIPSSAAILQSVEIRLNERGLRGAPVTAMPAAGRRVLVLGGSIALGWGVREEDTLSSRLEMKFKENGISANVLNAGVGNYNASRYVELFISRLRDLAPSDILVLYFFRDAEKLDPGGGNFLLRHSQLAVTGQLALSAGFGRDEDLVSHYRAVYSPESAGRQEMEAALRRLADYAREARIRTYLALVPELHYLENYPFAAVHEMMRKLSIENGFTFVDLLPAFSGRKREEIWAMPGDPHPNALGHRLMAEAIYPVLKR